MLGIEQKDSYRKQGISVGGAAIGGNIASGYATNAVQATPTLAGALSSIDDLNKRLHQLSGQMHDIARAVGGPYPSAGESACTEAQAPPAMQRLNDSVRESHTIVGDIEGALGAIRRALGA